jgi:hypothetical protein
MNLEPKTRRVPVTTYIDEVSEPPRCVQYDEDYICLFYEFNGLVQVELFKNSVLVIMKNLYPEDFAFMEPAAVFRRVTERMVKMHMEKVK